MQSGFSFLAHTQLLACHTKQMHDADRVNPKRLRHFPLILIYQTKETGNVSNMSKTFVTTSMGIVEQNAPGTGSRFTFAIGSNQYEPKPYLDLYSGANSSHVHMRILGVDPLAPPLGPALVINGEHTVVMGDLVMGSSSSIKSLADKPYALWNSNVDFNAAYFTDRPVCIGTDHVPADAPYPYLLYVQGDTKLDGALTHTSDARVKGDVRPIADALHKVDQLTGYTYVRTDRPGPRQAGVLAHEVLAVLPEAVAVPGNPESLLAVSYESLVPLLINAVKELKAEVAALKKQP